MINPTPTAIMIDDILNRNKGKYTKHQLQRMCTNDLRCIAEGRKKLLNRTNGDSK